MAVMVEHNPRAAQCIRENLKITHLEDKATVMNCDVITALKRLEERQLVFDIIFMDPPYNQLLEKAVLEYLAHSALPTQILLLSRRRPGRPGWIIFLSLALSLYAKKSTRPTSTYSLPKEKSKDEDSYLSGSFDPVTLGHYDIIERSSKFLIN